MRRVILFFVALFAVLFLSSAIIIHSLDLTALNSEYVLGKIKEEGLYENVIDSLDMGETGGLDPKAFVEIIGQESLEDVLDGLVEGFLLYLKDPSVEEIELGFPVEIFGTEITVSADELLGEEELETLRQAKGAVQLLLLVRTVSVIIGFGCLVLIVLVARGLKAKIRWLGYALLCTGILIIALSLLGVLMLSGLLKSGPLAEEGIGETVGIFFESILAGFGATAQLYGALFLVGGIILVAVSFALPFLMNKGPKPKKTEKKSPQSDRELHGLPSRSQPK